MSISSKNLIQSRLNWNLLLNALGITGDWQQLPAQVTCPRCQQLRLFILPDNATDGQSYWCYGCEEGGDLLRLAERTWDLSPKATLQKLYSKYVLTPISETEYRKYMKVREQRDRHLALWGELRKQSVGIKSAASIASKGNFKPKATVAVDLGVDEALFGVLPLEKMDELFIPGRRKNKRLGLFPRGTKRGMGYKNIIGVPLWDAPSQLSGWYFMGRKCDPAAGDTRIFLMPDLTKEQYEQEDVGTLQLPDILETTRQFGNRVLAIGDFNLALYWLRQNAVQSTKRLPIVGWYKHKDYFTRRAWQQFGGTQKVFWAPETDYHVLRAAIEADGFLARNNKEGVQLESIHKKISNNPEAWLETLLETAKPWYVHFSRQIEEGMEYTKLEKLLRELQKDDIHVRELVPHLSKRARDIVLPILRECHIGTTVAFNSSTVKATQHGWYRTPRRRRPELISNARIEIEQLLIPKNTGELYMSGNIHFKDHRIPFFEPAAKLEKNTPAWLTWRLAEEGHSQFLHDPDWGHRLMELAKRFSSISTVKLPGRVGWDPDNQQFELPLMQIGVNTEPRMRDFDILATDLPAANLHPHLVAPDDVYDTWAEQDYATTSAALFIALVGSVLRPMAQKNMQRITLVGPGLASSLPPMLEAFGRECHSAIDLSRKTPEHWNVEDDHVWPTGLLPHRLKSPVVARYLSKLGALKPTGSLCCATNAWTAAWMRGTKGWPTIHTLCADQEEHPEIFEWLLVEVLDHACNGDWGYQGAWLEQVQTCVIETLEKHGYDPRPFRDCNKHFRHPEQPAEAFVDMVRALHLENKFPMRPGLHATPRDNSIGYWFDAGEKYDEPIVMIVKKRLLELMQRMQLPEYGSGLWGAALKQSGVLLPSAQDVWVFPKIWWDRVSNQLQTGEGPPSWL